MEGEELTVVKGQLIIATAKILKNRNVIVECRFNSRINTEILFRSHSALDYFFLELCFYSKEY
jgi:hypothetical protein